jgi:hypothetical protein
MRRDHPLNDAPESPARNPLADPDAGLSPTSADREPADQELLIELLNQSRIEGEVQRAKYFDTLLTARGYRAAIDRLFSTDN